MITIPRKYQNKLTLKETEIAIKLIKDNFERFLSLNLDLIRVSAPLFVDPSTGLNDNLNGIEKPVGFTAGKHNQELEIVQSLAKWKRNALSKYGFLNGYGLYTDMNAIRPDEEVDNLHSIYVDQWDWEKVIEANNRNCDYLKSIVNKIIFSLYQTNEELKIKFPNLDFKINKDVFYITSEELLQMYPNLSPKERENEICKNKKTVFIIGIGHNLSNGEPHDGRSPDYDDWNLNGDILLWSDVLETAVEVSSMGIRVDKNSLLTQTQISNTNERLILPYHQDIINDNLPLTIGGGIGQSRICLLLLEKMHVGEVQSSYWPNEDKEIAEKLGAHLL
ncbi:MAG: aspartate--ammonia ligase [Bacilli bacterium]